MDRAYPRPDTIQGYCRHVMENAGEKAIFLHCLPAFHDLKTKIGKEMGERFNLTDMEVTDEVFESPQSQGI